jgi:hypothetical protein
MSSRTRRPTRYNDDTLVVGIDIAKNGYVGTNRRSKPRLSAAQPQPGPQ